VREIFSAPARFTMENVDSVYFGGGTPSRLSTEQLARIVNALEACFSIIPDAERTIEINPEDSTHDYLSALFQSGFNRLSVGIQSLRPGDLKVMRRAHTADQAGEVIDIARGAGFERLSVDLIFGLPDQTVEDWMSGVEFVVAQQVPHISTYGLTVEPKTLLAKWISTGQSPAPDDDLMADMYLATIDRLDCAGYDHYEISSFAIPGAESRHNSAYWRHANYVGFGPSAHSFWWDCSATRWSNVRSLRRYIDAACREDEVVDSREVLKDGQLASERIMLGLRTSAGLSRIELRNRYGYEFSSIGEERIRELQEGGNLSDTSSIISLTPTGRLVINGVTRLLCDDLSLTRLRQPQGG